MTDPTGDALKASITPAPVPHLETDDTDKCPICANAFKPDDVCATDIEMGTCHADCLDGSPVVDLDTGDELPDGKVETYPYSEVMDPAPVSHVLESDPVTLRDYCQQLLDMIENYGVDIEGEDNDLIAHISRNVDPAYVEPAALEAEGRDNG
jgi:hypothetical protein